MKKRIILCIGGILAVAFLSLGLLEFRNRQAVSEISHISTADIASVTVKANPPGKEAQMKEAEIDRLVEILHTVTVYKKDNSYGEYAGQWVEFCITKTDNTQITIAAFSPFIIINGVGYQAKYAPCQAMNSLANKIIEEAL